VLPRPGDGGAARVLNGEGATLVWTFEAGSHFEALTAYDRYLERGDTRRASSRIIVRTPTSGSSGSGAARIRAMSRVCGWIRCGAESRETGAG
jgi:hypothetical protein